VGVKLKDVLKLAGLDDPVQAQEEKGVEHVIFHALDGMQASSKSREKLCWLVAWLVGYLLWMVVIVLYYSFMNEWLFVLVGCDLGCVIASQYKAR